MNVHERIAAVLAHLGLVRAHFAGALAGEFQPLLDADPALAASVTLVNPNRLDGSALASLGASLTLVTGSDGLPADVVALSLIHI